MNRIRAAVVKPLLSLCLAAAVCAASRAGAKGAERTSGGPPQFKRLKSRSIGPAAGGRFCRAVGRPVDPLTYYAATAAGGVWRSADGGTTCKPVSEDLPVSSIGSIAVAASDPNVVYAGSGE